MDRAYRLLPSRTQLLFGVCSYLKLEHMTAGSNSVGAPRYVHLGDCPLAQMGTRKPQLPAMVFAVRPGRYTVRRIRHWASGTRFARLLADGEAS
jgi:hypothetical protein